MQSHPDYPSLISFTDTLDELGVPYNAVVAEKSKYQFLTYPLLAYFQTSGREAFALVSSSKKFEENDHTLLKEWNGVSLMIESGCQIICQEHNNTFRQEKNENILKAIAFSTVTMALLSTVIFPFNAQALILMLLSIAGIFICFLIALHSMGNSSSLTERFCSTGGNINCDKVLHSRASKLAKGITLADLGLIYFLGCTFFLPLSALTHSLNNALLFLAVPFMISLLGAFISVWYQWKVVKSWCTMCLTVSAIIICQNITFFSKQFLIDNFQFPWLFSIFSICLLISTSIWLLIKPLIKISGNYLIKNIHLLMWKRDPEIFLTLLFKQKKVVNSQSNDDIFIGNVSAPIQITMVCSPYCIPCAQAHVLMENIMTTYPGKIRLTVRFLANASEAMDKKAIAARYISNASLDFQKNPLEDKRHPVEVWFEEMNIEKFKAEYPSITDIDMCGLLLKQEDWARQVGITFTPTFFVNGYHLPSQYTKDDLKLLIPQIIENITSITSVYNGASDVSMAMQNGI
jgi:uncharacterized membrane protein